MKLGCLTIFLAASALPHAATAQEFDCLMDPAEQIELGSPASGLLDAVLVRRGDVVEKGQVVAELNSIVERSTVDLLNTRAQSTAVIDAQAEQLAMIEKRFARVSNLRERDLTTEEVFNQVESELIAARSLLFQAELNREIALKELVRAEVALSMRRISSPISGVVFEKVLSAGEYVSNDDHILKIVQLDPLKVEAFLPVSLYESVKVGDIATVRPVAPLKGQYEATITAVDRVFDAASGTFVIVLELPNPDGVLPAGHRCTLSFGEG